MVHFRFYRLDRDNRIFGREEYDLETDRDAIICAMELATESAIEVWEGDRKIAYIAKPPTPFGNEIQQRMGTSHPPEE